jgi:hypothetical protein
LPEIDKIVVSDGDAPRTITVAQWKEVPLSARVKLLGAKHIKFFAGAAEVPAKDALAQLR